MEAIVSLLFKKKKKKKKHFMAPFYGWGSTASRLQPLRGGSLLFTTKFPEVPGTGIKMATDTRGLYSS